MAERKKKETRIIWRSRNPNTFLSFLSFFIFSRENQFLSIHVLVERILPFNLVPKPPLSTGILTSVTAL